MEVHNETTSKYNATAWPMAMFINMEKHSWRIWYNRHFQNPSQFQNGKKNSTYINNMYYNKCVGEINNGLDT